MSGQEIIEVSKCELCPAYWTLLLILIPIVWILFEKWCENGKDDGKRSN